jgi:hypothetical protein
MRDADEQAYVVVVTRLMIGGRVFGKCDFITRQDLGLMRSALRSGAIRALPRGLEASEGDPELAISSQMHPLD